MAKSKIKKGDAVKVISGKEKGKTGVVSKVDIENRKVLIDGVNMVTKHMKPRSAQEPGGRNEQPAYMDASNVMIVCPSCKAITRVGKKVTNEDGKDVKIRICKKCGASLEVKKETKAKATAKRTKKKTVKAKTVETTESAE